MRDPQLKQAHQSTSFVQRPGTITEEAQCGVYPSRVYPLLLTISHGQLATLGRSILEPNFRHNTPVPSNVLLDCALPCFLGLARVFPMEADPEDERNPGDTPATFKYTLYKESDGITIRSCPRR